MPPTKMHAAEVSTDALLVRHLLAVQFPQWADLPIKPVSSAGTDNAIYRLGDNMVVRMPRIHWAVGQVDMDEKWLPQLAPFLPIAIPVPLAKGKPGEGYPWHWAIHRWLEGENPDIENIPNPYALAMELATFIAAMQRIDLADAPPAGHSLARRDAEVRPAIAALHGMIDTDAVTAAWEDALKIAEWGGPPVWIHGDLAPGNLLLVAGHLHAVIDFSGVGVGEPADDLRVAWNLLPASARPAFRAALAVDDATWRRGRAVALGQALVQLPYYHITNPSLVAQARHVINEVLADYEHGA